MTEQVTDDFSKMSLLIELVTDLCFKTCDISFYAVFRIGHKTTGEICVSYYTVFSRSDVNSL